MPPLQIEVTERRDFVVRLRTAGASLDQCAQEATRKFGADNLPVGYDRRHVWKDIQAVQERVYADLREHLTTFRMIQLERYENIIRSLWPKAITGKHMGMLDRLLQVMRDENKLLGLYAPQQVDMRVVQVDARIEELMANMAARREAEVSKALGAGGATASGSVVEGTARHL